MARIFNIFQKFVEQVSGLNFSLPIRIFHSVLVVSMVALLYNIPLNMLVGLPILALSSSITLILVGLLYYCSRFKGATGPARVIFCLVGTALFTANFFWNSGINGPTGYFFMMMLVIMVAIVPVKEYWYWVSSNLLLLYSLHLAQYFHPEWVPESYKAKADRFIDSTSAYTTVAVIVLACFYIIRRRYDAERSAAQQNAARLHELDAEKNKLFSIISHDLRSPLTQIQSYLEMLADYDLSEAERKDIKARLLQSTRGTLDMVNNVLHWSTSQMAGTGFKKQQLPAAELLVPLVQLFEPIAGHKSISLACDFAEDTTIWGNADMIQLVVRNLINNAVKFTAPGGKVLLTANCTDGTCQLMVKDSGNGKPSALNEKIFHLSSDIARGTANESGVGLGLALCRDYTELMGGKIWFESDAISGTTFFVELPAAP